MGPVWAGRNMVDSYNITLVPWQIKANETIMRDIDKKFGNPENEDSINTCGTFIVGPPGTGKTTLINKVVKDIQHKYPYLQVDITATTGAAATRLINAKTLASWLQVGSQALKLDKFEEIWPDIKKRKPERPKNCNILVIDEVSMLSQRSWESLNRICQQLRENPCEFGGIYVIALGDPLQLPPVPHDCGPGFGRLTREFVASCLERQYPGYKYEVANQMMRAEDKDFMRSLLKLIHVNPEVRASGIKDFREKCYVDMMYYDDALDYQEETGSIILSPVKDEEWSCNAYNAKARERAEKNIESRVIKIKGFEQKHKKDDEELVKLFTSKRALEIEEKSIQQRETWPPSDEVRTKQTYMIRANFTTKENVSVSNGDTGEILDYNEVTGCIKFLLYRKNLEITIPRHEFSSEWCEKVSYAATPLIPASAITIHKAQGATVSGIILDPRRMWAEEYVAHKYYTAFSRVRKMSDIRITSYMLDDILGYPDIQSKLNFIWSIPYMKRYLTPDLLDNM